VHWAYTRNAAVTHDGIDYHASEDLSGQAYHCAATLNADIVTQRMAVNNGSYNALKFSKTRPQVYRAMTSDHAIDWVRYQVANC
jgi:fructose-bisphosphate aldolase, class I